MYNHRGSVSNNNSAMIKTFNPDAKIMDKFISFSGMRTFLIDNGKINKGKTRMK